MTISYRLEGYLMTGKARCAILFVLLVLVLSACVAEQVPDDHVVDDSLVESVEIEGVGNFGYDPDTVETVRDDLFRDGHFSIFDVLVHLASKNHFSMNYHFDHTMNTYVIDDINGITNWWYGAHYDGGWPEQTVYRMDHYPFKDKMTIRFYETDESKIKDIFATYKDEIIRFNRHGGRVIIPEIIIDGSRTSMTFENIEITAHDLRNDIFQDGVITAIDVIMTLGDLEELTYELMWYDSIETAEVVCSYWVHAINEDIQHDVTGFVYEAGNWDYYLFEGNHIHLPSDTRAIHSPEYVRYFWIGLFENPLMAVGDDRV